MKVVDCFFAIYVILSLLVTVLVYKQFIYLTIDTMAKSAAGIVFSLLNPLPLIYWAILTSEYGPSVWVDSQTVATVFFIYPAAITIVWLVFLKIRVAHRNK